jgi:hypothetical protein
MRHVAIAASLALLGCTQPAPSDPFRMPSSDPDAVFGPSSLGEMVTLLGAMPQHFAAVRVVQPPAGGCDGEILPIVVPPARRPIAGQPFVAEWQTEVVPPVRPRVVSLLVSLRPMAAPVALGGGCWILVHPDHLIVPQAGSLLTHNPASGVMRLSWTPDASLVGQSFFAQALVLVPESPIRHLLSPLLEVHVGNQ